MSQPPAILDRHTRLHSHQAPGAKFKQLHLVSFPRPLLLRSRPKLKSTSTTIFGSADNIFPLSTTVSSTSRAARTVAQLYRTPGSFGCRYNFVSEIYTSSPQQPVSPSAQVPPPPLKASHPTPGILAGRNAFDACDPASSDSPTLNARSLSHLLANRRLGGNNGNDCGLKKRPHRPCHGPNHDSVHLHAVSLFLFFFFISFSPRLPNFLLVAFSHHYFFSRTSRAISSPSGQEQAKRKVRFLLFGTSPLPPRALVAWPHQTLLHYCRSTG